MPGAALAFALLAGILHVVFFAFESVLFTRPTIWARFGVKSQVDAEVLRPMALNQGFYNLFLAVGIFVGAGLCASDEAASRAVGAGVIVFACASMVLAGVVLLITNRRLARSAAIQAVPPAIALLLAALL